MDRSGSEWIGVGWNKLMGIETNWIPSGEDAGYMWMVRLMLKIF